MFGSRLAGCVAAVLAFSAVGADVRTVMFSSQGPDVPHAGIAVEMFKGRLVARAPGLVFKEIDESPSAGEMLVRIQPYLRPENSPGPEGYEIVVWKTETGGVLVDIAGNDRLGAMFGLGALYRRIALTEGGITVSPFRERSAPRYALRCANQAVWRNMDEWMRTATQARRWKRHERTAYLEELLLLGQNAIFHGGAPAVDFERYDERTGNGFNRMVPDLADHYGVKYVFACPANGLPPAGIKPEDRALLFGFRSHAHVCPSRPEARSRLVSAQEIIARHVPRLDYVMILPGDMAGCECDACRPWDMTYYGLAVEMATAIHRHKPQARVLFSNQEFQIDQNKRFFERYRKDQNAELSGYVYGPCSSENSFYLYLQPNWEYERFPGCFPASTFLKSRLKYLKPGDDVLAYVDIGHWKASQTAQSEIDPCWTEVYERRTFNVRPRRLGRAWREVMPYMNLAVGYSESIFDDFAKFFSLRLLWNPDLTDREIVREYAMLYAGENVADDLTDAIFLHERNVEGTMAERMDDITRCHELVEDVWRRMTAPYRRNNWRVLLFRQRAALDAYVAKRLQCQRGLIDRICAELYRTQAVPAADAIDKWIAEIDASMRPRHLEPLWKLALDTDDEIDKIAAIRLVTLRRFFARPDQAGAGWLAAQLRKMKGPDAASVMRETVGYARVGVSEFYDNCGTPGEMPHFDRKSGQPYRGAGRMDSASRPSQRSYCYSSRALEGVLFSYEGLDTGTPYRVTFTYPNPDGQMFALNSPNEFDVFVDGRQVGHCVPSVMHFVNVTATDRTAERRLLSPPDAPKEPFQRFEFDIPAGVTADGRLSLQFKPTPGRGVSTCISEIWLRKRK